MNGIHDLGGMHGIGAVDIQPDEPTFAADWERRAFGCNMLFVISGIYSIDESRHAMEKFPPAHYLETSYYEHWLESYEALLIEKGLLTQAEIEAGTADPATIGKDYGTFKAPRDMIAALCARPSWSHRSAGGDDRLFRHAGAWAGRSAAACLFRSVRGRRIVGP